MQGGSRPGRPRAKGAVKVIGGFESTIGAFEIKDESARLTATNNNALVAALENAGLEFIPENGGGAGIRLRKSAP
jgi:hypothetical protein